MQIISFSKQKKQVEHSFVFDKSVHLNVVLPKGSIGFIGYRIPLKIEIQNSSRKKVEGVKMTMNQVIRLTAGSSEFLQRKKPVFTGCIPDCEVKPGALLIKDALVELPLFIEPSILLSNLVKCPLPLKKKNDFDSYF